MKIVFNYIVYPGYRLKHRYAWLSKNCSSIYGKLFLNYNKKYSFFSTGEKRDCTPEPELFPKLHKKSSNSSLESATAQRPPNKSFTCLECGKVFNAHYNLTRHMPVHTGARPFICKVGTTSLDTCRCTRGPDPSYARWVQPH